MNTRTVEVEVSPEDVTWFAHHREWPVEAVVTQERVSVGPHVFRLFPGPDGLTHVLHGGAVIGSIDKDRVRNSTSEAARADLKMVRAAVHAVDYEVPAALELAGPPKEYVHPGACWRRALEVKPRLRMARVTAHRTLTIERRCAVCGEGFE